MPMELTLMTPIIALHRFTEQVYDKYLPLNAKAANSTAFHWAYR